MLVILGLLVGGVLSGQALIRSSEIRAQLGQIENFNTAIRTFQSKYLALPGDMLMADALRFNFYRDGSNGVANSGCGAWHGGCGDGDGAIIYAGTNSEAQAYQIGEPHLFWLDLTKSGIINDTITTYADGSISTTNVKGYLPSAKMDGLFVYVWANGVAPNAGGATPSNNDGYHYLTVASVPQFLGPTTDALESLPTIKVQDAWVIDKKVDDGMPQSGTVTAAYVGKFGGQIRGRWVDSAGVGGPSTAALASSSTSCYDNNNTAGQPRQYSTSVSAGDGANCAVSFRTK